MEATYFYADNDVRDVFLIGILFVCLFDIQYLQRMPIKFYYELADNLECENPDWFSKEPREKIDKYSYLYKNLAFLVPILKIKIKSQFHHHFAPVDLH